MYPLTCHLTSIVKKIALMGQKARCLNESSCESSCVEFTYLQRAFYAFKQIITLSLKLDAVVVGGSDSGLLALRC